MLFVHFISSCFFHIILSLLLIFVPLFLSLFFVLFTSFLFFSRFCYHRALSVPSVLLICFFFFIFVPSYVSFISICSHSPTASRCYAMSCALPRMYLVSGSPGKHPVRESCLAKAHFQLDPTAVCVCMVGGGGGMGWQATVLCGSRLHICRRSVSPTRKVSLPIR
jgi:hypothetical protein